ncbi:MAG TPA: hypothetical protein VKA30_02845 [Actinomycetota bacterium]|nr:hypothetical protein [Actinomycetota bacterium]
MADIQVEPTGEQDGRLTFVVTVGQAGDTTTHHVTLGRSDLDRWSSSDESPDGFVRRCFEFLLEREPKESILPRFDVTEIQSYFSSFEEDIRRMER